MARSRGLYLMNVSPIFAMAPIRPPPFMASIIVWNFASACFAGAPSAWSGPSGFGVVNVSPRNRASISPWVRSALWKCSRR